MAVRVRPATTLTVIVAISLAFQIIALVSVPITQSITLCTYDNVKFGVFGLCSDGVCTSPGIGYTDDDIQDLSGFSLPSNARHSVSKLLIVHPIAAGFTFVLFVGAILLHWHGPSFSLKLHFFLLLWCMPAFLLTLLSFLVDILLFVPHLDWGGWIMLASTVLIAICAILLCIMRRTVSSRKAMRKNQGQYGSDYQMTPLAYGYGTVDGGSDYKVSTRDEQNSDEASPFVRDEGNTTYNFDDSVRYDDIGNINQTQAYDSVRDSNNGSAQSNTAYRTSEILTAPVSAYRGYEYTPPSTTPLPTTGPQSSEYQSSVTGSIPTPQAFTSERPDEDANPETLNALTSPTQTAPYSSEIPMAILSDIPEVSNTASYPQESGTLPRNSKLTGPRPMPATPRSTSDPSDLDAPTAPMFPTNTDEEWGFVTNDDDSDEPSAPPLPIVGNDGDEDEEIKGLATPISVNSGSVVSNPELEREPTYRTRIAQKLDALQPAAYSTMSFTETDEDLLSPNKRPQRDIGELSDEDTTAENTLDYDTTGVSDGNTQDEIIPQEDDDLDQSYPSQTNRDLQIVTGDDASSNYSSRIPSRINTPVDSHFRRQPSLLQRVMIPEHETLSSDVLQSIGAHDGLTPSDVTIDDYPFPDPNERRSTPAPSFSNESIGSSTFTSVSQRGINPKYFEKNPEEYAAYVQRQNMLNVQNGGLTAQRMAQTQANSSDLLIASNPDFTIGSTRTKSKPSLGRR